MTDKKTFPAFVDQREFKGRQHTKKHEYKRRERNVTNFKNVNARELLKATVDNDE